MDPVTSLFAVAGVVSALALIAMALEVARRRSLTREAREGAPPEDWHL